MIPLTFHVPASAPTKRRITIGMLILLILENILSITNDTLIFSESPMIVAIIDVEIKI